MRPSRFSHRLMAVGLCVGSMLISAPAYAEDQVVETSVVFATAIRWAALSPDGSAIYTGPEAGGACIYRIDTADLSMTNARCGTNALSGIAVSPDGSTVLASQTNAGTVLVMSSVLTGSTTLTTDTNPSGVAFRPDGAYALAANLGGTQGVRPITMTGTPSVGSVISADLYPGAVAFSPDGTRAYVANGGSANISVLDTSGAPGTWAVIATVGVGNQPTDVTVSPDGSRVFVVNNSANSVTVVNAATNTVLRTITSFNQPMAAAVTPDGSRMLVTNTGANSVSIVDLSTYAIRTSLSVGSQPYDVVIDQAGAFAYVLNSADGTISKVALDNTAPPTDQEPLPPPPWLRQYSREQTEVCKPDWNPSWALWPRQGQGGFVCTQTQVWVSGAWRLSP